MTLYKFLDLLDGDIRSRYRDQHWEVGKWYTADGRLTLRQNGFHACKRLPDALWYVAGDVLALVEGAGECIEGVDTMCFRSMKITHAYQWSKADSVALAVYSAELVLPHFAAAHPDDDRPRQAIRAAKSWLENPGDQTINTAAYVSAAWAASAAAAGSAAAWAASAAAAGSAAGSAARADAARAARRAFTAAWATRTSAAADAAAYAARVSAAAIDTWSANHIHTLTPIEGSR